MNINLDHPKLSGETTVQGAVTEVAAMVGENVKLRRGYLLSTSSHGVVSSYLHTCPQPGNPIINCFKVVEQIIKENVPLEKNYLYFQAKMFHVLPMYCIIEKVHSNWLYYIYVVMEMNYSA